MKPVGGILVSQSKYDDLIHIFQGASSVRTFNLSGTREHWLFDTTNVWVPQGLDRGWAYARMDRARGS